MKRFGISGQTMAVALVGASVFSAFALGPKLFSPEAGAQPISIQAPRGAPMSFADLIERVEPAVVSVNVVSEREVSELSDSERFFDFFRGGPNMDQFGDENSENDQSDDDDEESPPRTREARSLGSGFFISADGLIVTNNHVIDGATKIEVTLEDGRELEADLVGTDPSTDLAVLRVKKPGTYKYVNFDNTAALRKGDWVVAVGNPFGFGGTATAGILSADGRGGGRDNPYTDYLQIDAAINRGNSGGPTFDLSGNVVGVNTAIISPTGGSVGIGFMIPAELANEVTQMLIKNGKVSRGYLGVSIGDFTEDMAEAEGLVGQEGAIISDVNLASPAEKGGLKRGDVITSVNGKTVTDASTTTRAVGRLLANTSNSFAILRDGKPMTINVTVGERPDDLYANDNQPQRSENAKGNSDKGDASKDFGVSFKALDAESRKALNLRATENGVVITDLDRESPLAKLGLVKGLAILEVNNQTVTSAAGFDRAINDARKAGRSKVLMAIRNPQGTIYSTLDLSEKE
jgi:serine protease Do